MKFSDIQDCGDVLNVIIPDSKTYKERRFNIIHEGFGVNPIKRYRRYVALRSTNSPLRFFLHYHKGKCSHQNVGTFGAIPQKIATFLNLENPKSYTGHSFRRSSATLLVNAGGDITSLKRHGEWESSKVAESYIEESFEKRVKIARHVFSDGALAINEETKVVEVDTKDKSTGSTNSKECGCSSSSICPSYQFGGCTVNFYGYNTCRNND